MKRKVIVLAALALMLCRAAVAQHFDSGSTGADGALEPTTDTVIDMTANLSGVYNYTAVDILQGVTVKFLPNQKNRPVVWLVTGDVNIQGRVDVSGQNASDLLCVRAEGGPGGWPGGIVEILGAQHQGLGPGGGQVRDNYGNRGAGGGHATLGADAWNNPNMGATYDNIFGLPLRGGSGGGGGNESANTDFGGGGGGAILIAASGTISVSGSSATDGIFANGGSPGANSFLGYGSGGTIRLVSNRITLSGAAQISANANRDTVGSGYIRLEAYRIVAPSNQIRGSISTGQPTALVSFPAGAPTLRIVSVGDLPVGDDPGGSASYPDVELPAGPPTTATVVVAATGLTSGTQITLRMHADAENAFRAIDGTLQGDTAASTATIEVPSMPAGVGTLYVRTK